MVTDIFIDGASDVTVQGSVVRLNLLTASATEKNAEGAPKREVRHRLIMTSQAAVEMHAMLEGALRRLTDSGLVKRKEDTPEEK